jgi:type IV secretion system protein VirD4
MEKRKKKSPRKYGIFFGGKKGFFNSLLRLLGMKRSFVKPITEPGHVALFGSTSSGKTSCVVKQTLYRTWNAPFVAIDVKGDLSKGYETAENCRKTKVISLRDELLCTYDPMRFIQEDGEDNRVANVMELVNALFPLPVGIPDPFWLESTRSLTVASVLYFADMGMDDFVSIATTIMTTPPVKLIKAIADSDSEMAKIFINHFVINIEENDDDEFAEELEVRSSAVHLDSKMLLGITQEITNRLSIFACDPRIQRTLAVSENQVTWDDLNDCNIFISVPEDRLEQYNGILTMMITQLIRTMERRKEMHDLNGRNQKQVLICLDEFARLGKIEILASAVSTLRSKAVSLLLVLQSLAQLDRIYGKETRRVIMDNMSYISILRVTDAESQKYFSDLIGTVPIEKISKNINYDANKKETGHSEQITVVHEPAIRPHEFASLKDNVVITPKGFERVKKEPFHEESIDERAKEFWEKTGTFIKDAAVKVASFVKDVGIKMASFFKKAFRKLLPA